MHAFFADGVDKMHIPWAVEGLPTLLHLSLFLFFAGLVIFLFNVDQEVFTCVVWWIGLFTMVYGLITLLPLIRHNSPYYGPLSLPTWFLYSSIPYVTFTILSFIAYRCGYYQTWVRCEDSRDGYRAWMLGGVEKAAEEVASKRSSEIDGRILGWTIRALGDDDSLEKFFEAILDFFGSKLVKNLERDFPETHLNTFWGAMDGFIGRTLSSNSVTESVKSRRVLICRDIMGMIPCPYGFMYNSLTFHFDQAPVSIERLQVMERWFTHSSHAVSDAAQARVAMNLLRIQGRDNRWIALASEVYGLAACDIEDNVVLGGDNVLLAILIHVSRQTIHSYKEGMLELVKALTQFDIRHTLPGPQHDFCTLWNELVQEAKKQRSSRTPIHILRLIRRLYITFHQGTDAAPTSFSASTNSLDAILFEPSSYPLCDIASHRPDPTAPVPLPTEPAHSPDASSHHSTSGGNTDSQQVKEASNIEKPSSPRDPTIPSKIGDSSRAPAITSPALPVHTSPCPIDTLPPGAVATALKNIPLAAPFSRPLEGNAQQDILAPHVKPDISETMSTMSAPAPTIPASTQHVLNTSLTSCDAGAVSTSDPLLPASSVVCHSAPTSPPPSRVPPFPKTLSRPTDSTAPHRLRARRLVNSGNMSFADAVLHLLVLPLPFRDLFKELGGLKGRSETGRGATPLVDATVRFSKEFIFKDNEPPQQVAGGKPREDKEAKKEHNAVDSFKPTYMYDAMNEKRQLKKLLVRSRAQCALFCY